MLPEPMIDIDALFGGPWGPLLIFTLRIFDVSLATVRILLAVKGRRYIVPVIGFFEILIWIFAVGNAIRHLDSGLHVLGYAAGFSAGNVVGLWIEEKLALGLATMRIISRTAGIQLADALRAFGFGVTEFSGQGREGRVGVIYTVVQRRDIPRVFREVDRWDVDAFVTVEEPRSIRRGWMHTTPRQRVAAGFRVAQWMRENAEKRQKRAREKLE
jgi:uncharacterized protein YebE (UPF0316 family)